MLCHVFHFLQTNTENALTIDIHILVAGFRENKRELTSSEKGVMVIRNNSPDSKAEFSIKSQDWLFEVSFYADMI